jgi:hypothetical protein
MATQPDAREILTKNHGTAVEATLLNRPGESLDRFWTLKFLRQGVRYPGVQEAGRDGPVPYGGWLCVTVHGQCETQSRPTGLPMHAAPLAG